MKRSAEKICFLTMLVILAFSSTLSSEDYNTTWYSSYKSYRIHFKSLSPSEVPYCEMLLKEILNDLDTKNKCNDSDNCVLIDQDPFGSTVPFPSRLSEAMKTKMKEYCERCDDGSFHSVKNEDLVNTPVCWQGKCMVKTSLNQKGPK